MNQAGHTSSCSLPTLCTFHSDTSIEATSNIVDRDGSQVISVEVTNCLIKSPISSSSPFRIKLLSPNGLQSLESTVANIYNTSPEAISYTVSQSSWVMGDTPVTLTLTFSIDTQISLISYLELHIPSQYTTSYPQNIYNETSIPTIQSGSITINGLTNPSTPLGFST